MNRLLCICALFVLIGCAKSGNEKVVVHAVNSVSHSYSFHADWGFHNQYLKDHKYVKSWCALYNADLSNANLLFLWGCDDRLAYLPKDIEKIQSFLNEGGGVMILGYPGAKSQNELAKLFGAEFVDGVVLPLKANEFSTEEVVVKGGAARMKLDKPEVWNVVVEDSARQPMLAYTKIGKGTLIVGARALLGDNPDQATDSINAKIWNDLWVKAASVKKVDTLKPFNNSFIESLEHREERDNLDISYSDYMAPYADAMFDISKRCRPVIEKRMGVPLSEGMASKIVLIPTDGGGYSSGEILALAVWWGDFPKREDSMIEFVTHESVHSWVLPFAEIWNEPIATYVGDLVMGDMGHADEAKRRIAGTIENARKIDPKFDTYDIAGKSNKPGVQALSGGAQNQVHWGKTYWIFEQLRKQQPDFMAKYFQAKRQYALADKITEYNENNTVAVVSIAMGKDMFPWFKSIGFDVNRDKAEIKF